MGNFKFLVIIFIFVFSIVSFLPTSNVSAKECELVVNPKTSNWAIKGTDGNYTDVDLNNEEHKRKLAPCMEGVYHLQSKLSKITWVLISFSGVAAVLSIIHSGYKYINSEGNSYVIEEAKKQMWYTIIGLFIIVTVTTIADMLWNAI